MQPTVLTGLSVLIVDDEVLLRKRISAFLERQGVDVTSAGTVEAARQFAVSLNFDFVLLDVHLPDGLGTDLLKEKVFSANTAVIVMTADGGVEGAVLAMQAGALDYLVKPFDPAELPLVLGRTRKSRQVARLTEHQREDDGLEVFHFGSALAPLEMQLQKILAADRRMETNQPPVLIIGETGTGKTAIARWLHNNGPRSDQPLIEVNCSALPESLAESELFGHERGAFTDARSARMGLFEAANGGTLFLDELPSLPLSLQAKVLTAIEDRKIRRVGASKFLPVDSRVIAATNCDLKQAVAENQFRQDLYHRLDLYRLEMIPLRLRGEDIIRLAEKLMHQLCRKHRLPQKTISPQGRERLMAYRWPGNVRELAHELERAVVFEDKTQLDFPHLLGEPSEGGLAPLGRLDPGQWFNPSFVFPESGFDLEKAIQQLIQHALNQTDGNVSAAARLLGVTRDYVRYRLAEVTPPES